jgi:TetR/AcrR family transcriptional repressor of nem operon
LKVTKERSAQDRASLIASASRLFRERGFDGVGVAEISKAAGVSSGSLYAHFRSKSQLAAHAIAQGFREGHFNFEARTKGRRRVADYLARYLSKDHRNRVSDGCVLAASASEIARQSAEVQAEFADGYLRLVGSIERSLPETLAGAERRSRALAIVASMVGGMSVARAVGQTMPELSDEILGALTKLLAGAGEAGAAVTPPLGVTAGETGHGAR